MFVIGSAPTLCLSDLLAHVPAKEIVAAVEHLSPQIRLILSFEAQRLCDLFGKLGIDLMPNADGSGQDVLAPTRRHVARDIADGLLAVLLRKHLVPHLTRLDKIFLLNSREERNGIAFVVAMDAVDVHLACFEFGRRDARDVVRTRSLVVERHRTVALEVGRFVRWMGLVDRQLLVVDPDAVTVSVRVGEQARLEHRVVAWLETRNKVRRIERDLFDLGKVVGDISVQFDLTQRMQRELGTRPDFGQIIDVDSRRRCIGRVHDLIFYVPLGKVASLDGFEEIFLVSIRRLLRSLVVGEVLGALLRKHVDLTVPPLSLSIDELESVT